MIFKELQQLEVEGTPIRVGSSGAGWMGSGFAAQMSHVPGMELVVITDLRLDKAHAAFIGAGFQPEDIVETSELGTASDAIRNGKRVITGDVEMMTQIDDIDVVTDVTPYPASGAETAFQAIKHGKDVVLINIEADVTVGPILKKLARESGVLYTVSSGDEPGCLMELYDFVSTLGFEVVVIGKGKNNPLDPVATPETVAQSARRSDKDPYQVASYVDGSKTMFEMTCAANATGCRPMKRGMNGPEATLENVSNIFALKEDGGITEAPNTVDFVQGNAMAGGVFITVRVGDQRIREDLQYLKVGKGKYSTFFRPYHLWFIEAPISIAKAVLKRETTLVPLDEPVADVLTIAKRDLRPGDHLDTFGGYAFYGVIDKVEEARTANALPLGLAPGAEIAAAIKAGQII
ncbi:MAG: NAD(P)H-dependent oxidoreductase, partial [Candidatus Promineifilaceae bacterium]